MPRDVRLLSPELWADQIGQLIPLLGSPLTAGRSIGSPDGSTSGIEVTLVDTEFWSAVPLELQEALLGASDALDVDEKAHPSAGGIGIAPDRKDRLTLSVEEAAAALGISRALAYEAVARNEIPHIRIGRRILIPRSRLQQLLDKPAD